MRKETDTPEVIILGGGSGYTDEDDFETLYEEAESAKPFMKGAKAALEKIKQLLLVTPSFIQMVRANIPETAVQAVFTDEQKSRLASGAVKLMTKKDGTLMANIVNTTTNKIESTVALQSVNLTPELLSSMTSFATQMQLAQIAEEIKEMQLAIEEVRKGQENDRLAMAYSCEQKLLQAMEMRNPELRSMALLRIASDAEDSRNMLMLSQKVNLDFIREQPESFFGMLLSSVSQDKINTRLDEIRDSLCAVNMVSLAEAMAYQELGESEAACRSLAYYGDYIKKTYLEAEGLVDKLDMIDPSPVNYWSQTLPDIQKKIYALPGMSSSGMPALE